MDQPQIPKNPGRPRILIAPLDWGLGHATRCIPVIREFLKHDIDVWLAGEAAQKELLTTEFPNLPFLDLQGYRISYSKTKKGLAWKMLMQGPKMRRAITSEQRWLKKIVKKYEFDAIISDNRFGLFHETLPCVYITHQLKIKSSAGKWTEKLLQKRNYRFINKFSECWVPDFPGENSLAAELSHPDKLPETRVHYVGTLTRFQRKNVPIRKNYLLIILSGPEPQRTILENKIVDEICHYPGAATIVRGLPGIQTLIPSTGKIHFYNHLPASVLNNEMQEAEFIISRSGYSSIMDIMQLQKKSILIPTPGQTEQEYLSKYLTGKKMAVTITQKEFTLTKALDLARTFEYLLPELETGTLLSNAIDQFCATLLHRP